METFHMLSPEHVLLCTDLQEACQSEDQLVINRLILDHHTQLHDLLSVSTEDIVHNEQGCTLVHFLHSRQMEDAYAYLLSYIVDYGDVSYLHRMNSSGKYPLDMVGVGSGMFKYAPRGS